MIFLLRATSEYTSDFPEMIDKLVINKFNVFKDDKGRWCTMILDTKRLVQMSQLLKEELIIDTTFIENDGHPTLEIYNDWRE